MPIDKPTAEALAVVAIASRPAGATRWDTAGILAALRKVHHLEAGEVAATVVRAACDPSLDTPAPLDGGDARDPSALWARLHFAATALAVANVNHSRHVGDGRDQMLHPDRVAGPRRGRHLGCHCSTSLPVSASIVAQAEPAVSAL